MWEGHALSEASKNRVLFTPPPLGGQSGSGVYTVIDGHTYLCAILTWKIANSKGGAIHIGNFLRAVKGEATYDTADIPEDWEYATSDTDLLIFRVPDDWEYVNANATNRKNVLEELRIRSRAHYAKGINGHYYLQDRDEAGWKKSVTFPEGYPSVEITKWDIVMRVRCPGGNCPPIIDPPNKPPSPPDSKPDNDGNDNPYGVLPPNFGKEFTPDTNKKLEEYKATIESLKGEIVGLVKQVEDLNTSLGEKNSTIESLIQEKDLISKSIVEKEGNLEQLNKKLDTIKSERNIDNEAFTGMKNLITTLEDDIEMQLNQIIILKQDLDKKGGVIDGLTQELSKVFKNNNILKQDLNKKGGVIDGLEHDTVEVKTQRNILGLLFGGSATGGLLWALSHYWKLRGKKRIKDMIEDRWDHTPEPEKPIPQKIQTQSQPEKNTDLRGLADYLKDTLESVLDRQIGLFRQEVNEKIEKIEKDVTKDIDLRIYNTVDDRDRIHVAHPTNPPNPPNEAPQKEDYESILDCIQEPSFPKASDRIKDFVELKKSDGEKVEELAFYSHLYKEAVNLLKHDRLIITKKSVPFKVNSQVKAADAIDSYVQDQFLKRVSSATISRHILYHEAMIGFLYKQAITRLKRGEFNVLGYKDVADSVERWVKTEFMRRMGFDF